MARWMILANGSAVGYEYDSMSNARRRANNFIEQCGKEEKPWFPIMVIVRQELIDNEWVSVEWHM